MRGKLGGFVFLLLLVLVLALMQFWAVKARERDWWWFNGGSDHMAFADLEGDGRKGHILIVERVPEEAPSTEFNVTWSCKPQQIAWGTAWTRDEDFNQMDRSPAPKELKQLHAPGNPMELQFLTLACSEHRQTLQVIRLRENRSPYELTHDAFDMVANGISPPEALQRAAAKDPN